jgi:hypothetical protein
MMQLLTVSALAAKPISVLLISWLWRQRTISIV